MPTNDANPLIHEDGPRFVEAIRYTAAETGFSGPLIEKDYYCSLVLGKLETQFEGGLVFKGGTSLSKIHNDFYRLSEDLDFMISMPSKATRGACRSTSAPARAHVLRLSEQLPCFSCPDDWKNESGGKHYAINLEYQSQLAELPGKIKFEISLRGEIFMPAERSHARTLLLDPTTQASAIGLVDVSALSRPETYAEKVCAALTRRTLAIRDYYDLHHALENRLIDFEDEQLITLTRKKVSAQIDPINTDPNRLTMLTNQLEGELRPVLKPADFSRFDLQQIFERISKIAGEFR